MDSAYAPHKHAPSNPITSTYQLLPGEVLLSVVDHPMRIYPEHPSSLHQLLRLTRSEHVDEIGEHGPALASTSMPAQTIGQAGDTEYLHLFEVVFGRDSLRVADFLLKQYPKLARTTLLTLAQYQGVYFDVNREEEPGGIAHEIREDDDPIAIRQTEEKGWGWPYYATVDATPEFVRLLCRYVTMTPQHHAFLKETYTDRLGVERTMQDALDNAIAWIERRRAKNPEGLVEYKSTIPRGLENQSWKDSWDSFHHADGTVARFRHGIAAVEVQVAAYEALASAADLYDDIIGHPAHASALRNEANQMKHTIFTHFWTEDKGGYFIIGTDRSEEGGLRQLKIRTSNMGHVLNSRLLEGDDPDIIRMREAIIGHLLSPEMLARAGVRTLASDEVRYRPGSYHNGSVWLWDSHFIANGLRRHGYTDAAHDLDQRMLDVVEATRIFPEYVRGDQHHIVLNHQSISVWDESEQLENPVEQPPQEVQAWTVAAVREVKSL